LGKIATLVAGRDATRGVAQDKARAGAVLGAAQAVGAGAVVAPNQDLAPAATAFARSADRKSRMW